VKGLSGTLPFSLKTGDNENVPVMLVSNKSDKTTERKVFFENGFTLTRELKYAFIKTSAKTYFNVKKTFYDMIRLFRRQK
jgi:GTPase KRas